MSWHDVQRLNEAQIAELFDPPTEQRELVRHYTLSDTDLTAIKRCRGDHNRLGHALMRCYLRYPGRAMRAGERPPAALLAFVAEQIDVLPESIDKYLAEERNRQRHAIECQDNLGSALSANVSPLRLDRRASASGDRERSARPSGRTGDAELPRTPHCRPVSRRA